MAKRKTKAELQTDYDNLKKISDETITKFIKINGDSARELKDLKSELEDTKRSNKSKQMNLSLVRNALRSCADLASELNNGTPIYYGDARPDQFHMPRPGRVEDVESEEEELDFKALFYQLSSAVIICRKVSIDNVVAQ